jgi:RNA polymerase sigma factor (sigma-70 family)
VPLLDGLPDSSPDPCEALVAREQAVQLMNKMEEALLALTTRQWEVFRRRLDGQTYAQIARDLSIRPDTVVMHLQAARKKILKIVS